MLEVKNLSISYGDVPAVKNFSFSVKEKGIITLLGANAAGKTTTIKALSGLLPASTGKILFNGERVDTLAPHLRVERGIVQVPEGRKVFPFMSIYENLLIGTYSKVARKQIKTSLEYVYSLFPILKDRSKQNGWDAERRSAADACNWQRSNIPA